MERCKIYMEYRYKIGVTWSDLTLFVVIGVQIANFSTARIDSRINALVELLQEKGLLKQEKR